MQVQIGWRIDIRAKLSEEDFTACLQINGGVQSHLRSLFFYGAVQSYLRSTDRPDSVDEHEPRCETDELSCFPSKQYVLFFFFLSGH